MRYIFEAMDFRMLGKLIEQRSCFWTEDRASPLTFDGFPIDSARGRKHVSRIEIEKVAAFNWVNAEPLCFVG